MEPKFYSFIFTARRRVTVGVTRGRYASGTAHPTCSSNFIVTVCRQKRVAELRRFGPDRKWKIRLPPAGHAKSVTMMGMSVRSSSFMCVILLVLGGTLMYHVRGRTTLVIRNTCIEPCKETPSPGQSRSWKHPPTTSPAYKSTTSPRASFIT